MVQHYDHLHGDRADRGKAISGKEFIYSTPVNLQSPQVFVLCLNLPNIMSEISGFHSSEYEDDCLLGCCGM
jgi:hypothetical protein